MRKKHAYVATVALCAVAAVAGFSTSSGSSTPPFVFSTVSPAELASNGVTFTAAQAAPPGQAVSQSVVNSNASAALGQAAVRESHYVHCVDTNEVPAINEDCYAVSVDPSNIPVWSAPDMPDPAPMKWAVVLIDPTSGKVLIEKAGNN